MRETIPKDRPTQEERTDAMRARLLEATIDLIAEEGWAQASTQKICKRAGVSRGAQTHHFPTKVSLLIAAVEEITARYQRSLDGLADVAGERAWGLEDVFDFLWDACFEGNLLNCWMEVMVAARTDAALHHAVQDTDSRALLAMRALGEKCDAGAAPGKASAADLIELTVYLLRGMVIQSGVHPDQKARQRLFDLWKQFVQ